MAGELLTQDGQVEWFGILLGAGTDYIVADAGITGLGVPEPRTTDVPLDHADGAWLGRDYASTRVITIPVDMVGTATHAAALYRQLAAAWAPTSTNGELHLRLPGFGHLWVAGRPRGLTDDLSKLHTGHVAALATFMCGDPTIHWEPA